MRILLDESLPIELRSELVGHDVRTVQELSWSGVKNGDEPSWSGVKNGDVLSRAADRFDVFLTADQNLRYQQNLSRLPGAVVVLVAKSNRIEELRMLVPSLTALLSSLQPRTLTIVDM